VAVLLREHGAPEGLGPVHSIGIGPASVMSADLAERCNSFVTSLCLRSAAIAHFQPALAGQHSRPLHRGTQPWT
jgi:hypothetical protein